MLFNDTQLEHNFYQKPTLYDPTEFLLQTEIVIHICNKGLKSFDSATV